MEIIDMWDKKMKQQKMPFMLLVDLMLKPVACVAIIYVITTIPNFINIQLMPRNPLNDVFQALLGICLAIWGLYPAFQMGKIITNRLINIIRRWQTVGFKNPSAKDIFTLIIILTSILIFGLSLLGVLK